VNKYIIIPRNLVSGKEAKYLISINRAMPLAGSDKAFLDFEIQSNNNTKLDNNPILYSINKEKYWNTTKISKNKIKKILKKYSYQPKPFLGLKNQNFYIMGILNITPDSFYHKSRGLQTFKKSIEKAIKMYEEGASIIDIGGESTKPGSFKISEEEEQKRIIPVISELSKNNIPISCDTRNSATMQAAIDVGASIINDISSLSDKKAANVISKNKVGLILMHMQRQPNNMQISPQYKNVSFEITKYLKEKRNYAIKMGIKAKNILIDPGIGFGKNDIHNLKIFNDLTLLHSLNSHIMIGASRKSVIGRITNAESVDRLPGSISLAIASIERGVKFFRVHDVKETKQALTIWNKI